MIQDTQVSRTSSYASSRPGLPLCPNKPSVFIKFRPACPRAYSGPHVSGSKLRFKLQSSSRRSYVPQYQNYKRSIAERSRSENSYFLAYIWWFTVNALFHNCTATRFRHKPFKPSYRLFTMF